MGQGIHMKKKILVVDNSALILEFMTNLLEKQGHQVKTADDGLSALDILMTYTPEVMFIDLVMPNINGAQLCRIIQNMPALKGTYTVILSATMDEKSRGYQNLGADAFIAKGPFDEMGKHVLAAVEQSESDVPRVGSKEIMGSKGVYKQTITKELMADKGHLEMILSNISEGVIELTLGRRIIFANPVATSLMGISEEKLLGTKFPESIRGRDRESVEMLLSKIEGGLERVNLDTPLLVNGRNISLKLLRVKKNGTFSIMVILNDVTAVIQAEAVIKKEHHALEQQRLTQIVDFLPDATMVIDTEGRVIAWNRAIEQMTGVKAEDMLGKGDYEYAVPFYGERRPVLIDLVGQWDKEIEEKYRYVKKNENGESLISETYDPWVKPGGFLWNKASLLYDNAGEVMGAIESIRDITEMKEYERALIESEEKYRLLVENATDAIFIAQDGMLKFGNRKAEKMTGYSGEELAQIPIVDLIHPEDRNLVFEKHLKRLKGKEVPSSFIFRLLNRSGEVLTVELNAVVIKWEGRPATITFLKDITEQKKLEAQLQQVEKLEAIGTLAGGIAHDFNNLLMAIQGRASLAMMGKDVSHPDFEHFKGIEGHVESAVALTRQLLGFARGGKYEVKPTNLNELIKKENEMFGRTRKEIAINGTYEKETWVVEVDRGQIEQVLLNLYVNAWQAMPGGGELYVETENVVLGEEYVKPFVIEPGAYVKISVRDTGVGMDKEIREKIFDPFFTTKEIGRGTGLGLSSAYGIIKNHGGFINVYSEKGHGSIFNIYLPSSEKEVIDEKEHTGETLLGRETVLFVDDEEMIVEVARELLERLGYRTLVAGSGREAVALYAANRERIDVVILDMIMPDMGGGETYNRIKEMNPEVKVLLSSGYSINGTASEIMNRGCNGFIQKPFKIKELSQKLREILD
jgi:two-component system, cell cycle sensor histidine kinase and response regulator CckA